MTETFTPPLLFSLGDIIFVGIAGLLVGAFIALLFFVVATR